MKLTHLTREEITQLQIQLNQMNPVDLADEFAELSEEEVALRIKLLRKELLADTFAELNSQGKLDIIKALSKQDIRDLINELDEDEVVDTLQELPANMVEQILDYIDSERRPTINQLLGYPEESAGSIMTVNFIRAKDTLTTEQVIQKVMNSNLDADKLEQIWITDPKFKLIGYLNLADLFRHKQDDFSEIIQPITAVVSAYDDQEIISDLAYRYALSAIPVVDSDDRLVGTVPAEWILEIMAAEYNEDISNISGVQDDGETPYLETSTLKIARSRITWLIICLITATLTGFIIQRYEAILATSVILTAYIPMLMDSGGNAGSQSSTTLIRSITLNEIEMHDIFNVFLKELKVGLYVGGTLAIVNLFRMMIMDSVSLNINITVTLTLFITIILSKIIGGILPLIAIKFKVDPTIMAGPIITTVVDTIALLIYFEVAQLLIGI